MRTHQNRKRELEDEVVEPHPIADAVGTGRVDVEVQNGRGNEECRKRRCGQPLVLVATCLSRVQYLFHEPMSALKAVALRNMYHSAECGEYH